jgi:plasmid rolling circle replication initiator protein Rep
MWLARFYSALPTLISQHSKARFLLLTLTWRNVAIEDLRVTLRGMNKAWERLSQRKDFRVVMGWVRTTEVTRADDGRAHPHFHVLLMVPANYFGKNYISQPEWVQMWRTASRLDYDPDTDIRTVKNRSKSAGGLMSGTRETLKYAVKPSDMKVDASWLYELTRQLRKLRFVASGGILKNILRPEKESDEDLLLLGNSGPDDEKPSVYFDWQKRQRRYKRGAVR